jgi:DNA-binding protein HU-beta
MNKLDLINVIGEKSGLNKSKSKKALNAFIGVVTEELAKGNHVRIASFGTFKVYKRGARKGIIPSTKKEIHIPAKTVAKFNVALDLANAVGK